MTRRMLVRWSTAFLIFAGALPSSARASDDIFLKIANITGESADDTHRNEIDLLSWSWGTSTGTGKTKKGAVPPACIQDLTLVGYVSAASPQLIMNAVAGTVASDAVLTVRRAGDQQQEFLTLKMTNVSIVSYQISETAGGTAPGETYLLHFDTLHGEYRRQGPRGELLPTPIVFDIAGSCN